MTIIILITLILAIFITGFVVKFILNDITGNESDKKE